MKKRRVLFLGILVLLSLLMSACAGKSQSEEMSLESAPKEPSVGEYDMAAPEMEESMDSSRGFETGAEGSMNAVDRMVIYNANLSIAVENPDASMQKIVRMAENAGGFVVSSNIYKTYSDSGRSLPRASITIRVPAGQLESIMDTIKGLVPDRTEDVLSENVSGQDVTSEYTDLESRLRNLEAAEAELTQLMEEARDPEDVLNIFDELTYFRGEIEIVKGRMKYLEESARLSAISVDIVAKASLQPIEIAGWEPKGTVKEAVEALINTVQFVIDGAIWLGIYCLPFLIPLGIAAYFLIRYFRKRRAEKKARKTEVIEKQASEE